MARVICIAGESGSGKTTSMRNLDPKTTYYIDCDRKGLSWRGWRQQYNRENKNYYATDNANCVGDALIYISEKRPEIKTIVIDTIGNIMVADEMRRMREKGYDKWMDLATGIWNLIDVSNNLRSDLFIIYVAHTQTERDESGYIFTKIKTNGRKLEKICLESKFTTVLIAKCVEGRYIFETHAKNSTAKTPLGAFEADEIDNDIVEVIKVLEEF